ncbi:ankyrin repeat family protein [Wolbachia endosymbiont of Trichogramma pretiosum]|nr:ankyrin repeat domain-containing protein [Wolbachia endosymbiont of Trichogramma pretiosum]OCA06361.1 ankyrin repeat family protein [Wolbachia endosymbiont of Trichogramma pretiosum]
MLASNGTSIDKRESTEGHTPFHLATLYGNKNAIQALVDKG